MNLTVPSSFLDQHKTRQSGNYRTECPVCSASRKHHKHERCLSITVAGGKAVAYCHHCGAKGATHDQRQGRGLAGSPKSGRRNSDTFRALHNVTSRW